MSSIEATLAERESRYGSFSGHAKIAQDIKYVLTMAPRWQKLSDSQKEALEMIAHKMARVLNGDPNYGDNWHDIAGYATLVEDEINAGFAETQSGITPAA